MYSKDFKKSNKILFYTSFGKYMKGSKPLYNKNNDPQTQDLFTQPGQQDEIA